METTDEYEGPASTLEEREPDSEASRAITEAAECLLITSDIEKSPEMRHPGMERIEPSEPELREAASRVETRQEEKDLDKEFYDFMDGVQDLEMEVDNRVVKRKRDTGTMTVIERELQTAIEKLYNVNVSGERNKVEQEIELFHNLLENKKIRF